MSTDGLKADNPLLRNLMGEFFMRTIKKAPEGRYTNRGEGISYD
jgi:hypothetical protein